MAFHAALFDGRLGYTAQDTRQLLSALLGDTGGVFGSGDLLCSVGSGQNTNVAAGRAAVLNFFAGTQAGLYLVRNDASVAVQHNANSSGNPRVDLVVVKVYDSETGGDSSDVPPSPVVLQGTATTGATLGNLTGAPGQAGGPPISIFNYLPLAYALVPNGWPGSGALTYLDARIVLNNLIPPVDTGWVALSLGTGMTAGSLSYYVPSPSYTPSARLLVDRVFLKGVVTGTGANANITVGLPDARMKPTDNVGIPYSFFDVGAAVWKPNLLNVEASSGIISVNIPSIGGGSVFPLDGLSFSVD